MEFLFIPGFFILSLLSVVSGNVPVLLWESSKSDRITMFPALHKLSSEEFQQYLRKKVHNEKHLPLVVLFLEQNLSVEDFSWQDSQGQGYFPQTKYVAENAANVEFLPSVRHPIEAVKHLSKVYGPIQYLKSDQPHDIPNGCGKLLHVKMQEAKTDQDRTAFMRTHDVEMVDLYSRLLSKCSHVVAIFSGEQSSWMDPAEVFRLRRSVEDNVTSTESLTVYQDGKGVALLISKSPPTLHHKDQDIQLGNDSDAVITGDASKPSDIKLFTKFASGYRLTFNFDNNTTGYWYLRSVDLLIDSPASSAPENYTLKPSQEIVAPLNMSYHSGSPVIFRSGSVYLKFNDLQVQPFFLKQDPKAFGDAVDAATFFTPAIWSGIFVTFLLAIIFTWGISMIMDIRTMDQFDDPKGKTITVSTTE